LTELQRLNVHSNQINGTVPSCFSSLPQLQILNLNFNQMTGALPLMTNLTELYLNMNDISQDLPTLVASMPHLKVLSARENRFYGDIELAFDHLAEQLVLLDLMGNQQLGGAFPHKLLYHAPQLEILSLGDNAISGKLTWSIPYNDKLRFLSIHSNDLEGILPPAITNLTALTHLIAHHNHFTGPLPQTLSTNLRSLFLSDNPFTAGPLPDEWASLSSMVAFHIGGSDRTGDLPAWLGQNWTQLELLDMSRNNFTGGIPESWGELPQLEYLFLSHNGQITGPLPESFQSLSNLKQAFLLETGIAGNWQFMCQHEASKVSVLVSNAEDCSCCVLCVDADCANNDMSLSESFEWKYRSYWGP
jgi:Leucine-rich repeat (LRR) protein